MTGQKGRVHSLFACSLVFFGWNVSGARDHGERSGPVLLRESQCLCSEETNFCYQRKLTPKSWWLSWQRWGEGVGQWEAPLSPQPGRRKQGNAPRPASLRLNRPEPGFLEWTRGWKCGEATVIGEQQGCLPYGQRRTNTNEQGRKPKTAAP